MATGAEDSTVRVTRVADGKEVHIFASAGPVNDVAFSPDGQLLAAGAAATIRVWDLAKGGERLQNLKLGDLEGLEVPGIDAIARIAFQDDGRTLLVLPVDYYKPWLLDWRNKKVGRQPLDTGGIAKNSWRWPHAMFSPGGRLMVLVQPPGWSLDIKQVFADPNSHSARSSWVMGLSPSPSPSVPMVAMSLSGIPMARFGCYDSRTRQGTGATGCAETVVG